jgi:RNA polymerase sigma factor for flagellar operon FliA
MTVEVSPEIMRLVEEILPQARGEAWKVFQTAKHALELDELTSIAYTGLWQAAVRWDEYCARKGFSPEATQYFAAYATRRMRGAMLDAMRSNDWLTRSMRSRAKALRDAGQDLGRTEAELSESTSLTKGQIRETLAGVARKPISVDAEGVDIADTQGVESQVVVDSVLSAVVKVMQELPLRMQVVLCLRYFCLKELREIASLLGETEAKVSVLHVEGVIAVHEAMLKVVQELSTWPRYRTAWLCM